MKLLPIVALVFLALMTFACTDSNSSPKPPISPTALAALAPPESPTPCPVCPEPIPCPEQAPCPVCPEPVICPACICPTCPDCPTCLPATVCPDCPVCPPVTFCLPPLEPAGASQQACSEARMLASHREVSITQYEEAGLPTTYLREELAAIEAWLNAHCR